MMKLDRQKLSYQINYTNLHTASSSQNNQNFGMIPSFDSCDVTRSKSSNPVSSNHGSQQLSFTTDNSFGC